MKHRLGSRGNPVLRVLTDLVSSSDFCSISDLLYDLKTLVYLLAGNQ